MKSYEHISHGPRPLESATGQGGLPDADLATLLYDIYIKGK